MVCMGIQDPPSMVQQSHTACKFVAWKLTFLNQSTMHDLILFNPDSAIIEAMAYREALQWLRVHEFDMVEVESDSQILILGIH